MIITGDRVGASGHDWSEGLCSDHYGLSRIVVVEHDSIIARHARHRDLRMFQVYDRPTDLFNDAALMGAWW